LVLLVLICSHAPILLGSTQIDYIPFKLYFPMLPHYSDSILICYRSVKLVISSIETYKLRFIKFSSISAPTLFLFGLFLFNSIQFSVFISYIICLEWYKDMYRPLFQYFCEWFHTVCIWVHTGELKLCVCECAGLEKCVCVFRPCPSLLDPEWVTAAVLCGRS